jgi:hypothetical protein
MFWPVRFIVRAEVRKIQLNEMLLEAQLEVGGPSSAENLLAVVASSKIGGAI